MNPKEKFLGKVAFIIVGPSRIDIACALAFSRYGTNIAIFDIEKEGAKHTIIIVEKLHKINNF